MAIAPQCTTEILREIYINVHNTEVKVVTDPSLFEAVLEAMPPECFVHDRINKQLIVNQVDSSEGDEQEACLRIRLPVDTILSKLCISTNEGDISVDCAHPTEEYGMLAGELDLSIREAGTIAVCGVDIARVASLRPVYGDIKIAQSYAKTWLLSVTGFDRVAADDTVHGRIVTAET